MVIIMKNMDTVKERVEGFDDVLASSADEGRKKIDMPTGIKSEKGVVLVVVLILSAVVLAVITALVYLVISGTQISGIEKRYKTSFEATKGGSDVFYQYIGLRGDLPLTSSFTNTLTSSGLGLTSIIPPNNTCSGTDVHGITLYGLQAKLMTPTWSWNNCDSSVTIDPTNATPTYDMKLVLGTVSQYNFYAKIVNTITGNSASTPSAAAGLYTGSVITGMGQITVVSIPYLYAIEVYTESKTNPAERAKFSILYQY